MKRRDVLAGGAAAAMSMGLARPSLAQKAQVLRYVPQAGLANPDPIWTTATVASLHGYMVWDTLYGIDEGLIPRLQMLQAADTSSDGLTWNFKLREGLFWTDGEPVRSIDCITSIKRWARRDGFGQRLLTQTVDMKVVDDKTFQIILNKPYPLLPYALGGGSTGCFIMPERISKTDPFTQITEYVGSGPMVFNKAEWVPGAKAVFDKFDGYVPRQEAADWLSGGKRIMFDRIEWDIISDPATVGAALQNGEVDWAETPLPDLIPLLKRNRNIKVDIADPLGNIGSLRMNHLQPPFNDVRARRAVLMALSQEEYMQAVVGDNPDLWKPLPSFFTPGTPFYTEAGGDILKGPRNYEAAKKLLSDAGLLGAKVTLLVATDVAITKAEGDVTNEMLKKIGFEVDYVATDWGTVGARRAKKDPPSQGGWNIFHTWHAGADCINPAPYTALDSSGQTAWFGWPKSDEVQKDIAEWYDAPDAAAEKKAMDAIDIASFENVTYGPTGFFLMYQAWRSNLSGIVRAPFPVFWGVQKT
jgi:peptide/nickel transport system substrate-binding protein